MIKKDKAITTPDDFSFSRAKRMSRQGFFQLKLAVMSDSDFNDNDDDPSDPDSGVAVEEAQPKLKRPQQYKVILLNDDYTPMEFVVHVLEKFFILPREKAVQIMLHVHTRGIGICGVFSREIAETKVVQVNDFSRDNEHPLQCTMERA